MIEIINLDKLSNDGFKQPANDPTKNTPDNITHAQLRYNTFTSSFAIQGTVVVGASSSFEFDLTGITYTEFKLYTSTNGITYTEKKSYGGANGKTIYTSAAGAVLTTGNQTVAGIKTFSDIPIISSTATTATQAVNKSYVDAKAGIKQWKGEITQGDTNPPTLLSEYINTTGATVTFTRESQGYYLMIFSSGWMGGELNQKLLVEYLPFSVISLGQSAYRNRYYAISQYFEDPLADTVIEIQSWSDSNRVTLADGIDALSFSITLYP